MQRTVIWAFVLQLSSHPGERQQPRAVVSSCVEEQEGERVQRPGVGHVLQQPLLLLRLSSCEWQSFNMFLNQSHPFFWQFLNQSTYVMFWTMNSQKDSVKCTSTQTQTVTCLVGYPALKENEEVSVSTCAQFWFEFSSVWFFTFFFYFRWNFSSILNTVSIKCRTKLRWISRLRGTFSSSHW